MSDLRSVLVTGGSGFVGRRLVERLVEDGFETSVLSRDPGRARRVLPEGVRCSDDAGDRALPIPDAVVNLAGAGIADRPWTASRRAKLMDSRIAYTERLHARLAESGRLPRVVVSGSAVGYYGPDREARFTEADGPGAGFAADLCRRWEQAAERFADDGARVVLARLGLVLGPGGLLARMKPAFALGLGGRLGDGRQFMSWVHLADVVGLLRSALDAEDLSGPLNVTAPEPVRNAEFTAALGRAMNRPARLPVPAFVLENLLGDMARELLTNGAAVLPERARAMGYRFRFARVEEALADLA